MTELATFLVEADDVPALRQAVQHLSNLGYCETRVRERLGLADLCELPWRAVPIYRDEGLANRDPLALAIDLFLLQGTLTAPELARLFDATRRAVLVRAGLLALAADGSACARASLYPVGGRLIFSDLAWPLLPHPGLTTVPYDQVMFVGADSYWLARAVARRPISSALDLCTGSGIHALLAAAHARRVLAVDINPRAARCTRFNASALGIANLTVAVGDLFAAVPEERFDLITANPPFVPSPVNTLAFRDGGLSGDDVHQRLVTALPRYLALGGTAQIVTEFGESDEHPFADRVRAWLGNAPMDLHILRLRVHSAASYAMGHAAGSDDSYGAFLASVKAWADNLRAHGYTRVVSVLLAFKWSDPAAGPPWTRSDEVAPPSRNIGTVVETIFAAEHLVRRADLVQTLESRRLCRVGTIGLSESQVLGRDLGVSTQARVLESALHRAHALTPAERELLRRLDTPQTLADLLAQKPALKLDPAAGVALAASLLRRGLVFLVPA